MNMTWEETILHVRKIPDYENLLKDAYLEKDLLRNASRFKDSEEFKATLGLVEQYQPDAETLLDIGAGNGISTISFAQKGFHVTAVEPDSSDTVGRGAIAYICSRCKLHTVKIIDSYAEKLPLADNSFDVVYARQALHHAHDLNAFVAEAYRVLKPGGTCITVRDHVVFNASEKKAFLKTHPLHRFYGGENAFSFDEYKSAFIGAGFILEKTIRHFDSVINFAPQTQSEVDNAVSKLGQELRQSLTRRAGRLGMLLLPLYRQYIYGKYGKPHDESRMPGRLYAFIVKKTA